MIQTTNFPLSTYSLQPYGGWEGLRAKVKGLSLDGLEFIADPDNFPEDIPLDLAAGYHMTFYVDWLDFWRQDEAELMRKFGSWETVNEVYRGTKPDDLMQHFQEDMAVGIRLKAPYMVFHVSDVSLEEGYTYRWLHSDMEVLDGAIGFINLLLDGIEPTFDFLVENQWWPGFTFTEPEKTEYLLRHINYPRTGIMLDTGHLMNTNWKINNQREGIRYILEMIDKHGEISKSIYGLHFHQSVSGAYCRKTAGKLPEDFPLSYYDEFSRNYAHILQIDRHQPWTDEACVRILECVRPKYLTHELSSANQGNQWEAVKQQLKTIRKNWNVGRVRNNDGHNRKNQKRDGIPSVSGLYQ